MKPRLILKLSSLFFCLLVTTGFGTNAIAQNQETVPLEKALTPDNAKANAQSKALLLQQMNTNAERAQASTAGRLWFAGFGLDSESKAFRGDVDLVQKRVSQMNPNSIQYAMDNHPQSETLTRPFAHLSNINDTLKHIGKHKAEGDLALVFLTAHGSVPFLATQIGSKRYANINDGQLATMLKALKDMPTIVIISACHSGSLIPALESPNRIILTAAAKTKTSYGCQPLSNNTFFVDELFGDNFDARLSLKGNFEAASKRIQIREADMKLVPSEPQIYIGEKMKALIELPLAEALVPKRAPASTATSQ